MQVKVPDVEFIVNYSDYPKVRSIKDATVFSMCGSDQLQDLMLPTYDVRRWRIWSDC